MLDSTTALVGSVLRRRGIVPGALVLWLALAGAAIGAPGPRAAAGAAPKAAGPDAADGLRSGTVAWIEARTNAELDAAFARARRETRPLLLYWGAAWCPPCQHLEATLFHRADFVAASRRFVVVHLDGDSRGAQQASGRFSVVGYPTLVLFDPQGRELTRLPGEVDAPQVLQALQAVLAAGPGGLRSAADWAAAALRGETLPEAAWRQLAWYSWDTDEGRLAAQVAQAASLPAAAGASAPAAAAGSGTAALLARLAKACPSTATSAWIRLQLKAVMAGEADSVRRPPDEAARQDAGAALLRLLGEPERAREQVDLVTGYADKLPALLSSAGSAERTQLMTAWAQAAERLQADTGLARADRLGAWLARVELQRLARGEGSAAWVDAALAESLRSVVALHVREAGSAHERQSLVTMGAHTLARAGLWSDAERLLTGHLADSPWPYYLMSQLAGQAKARGDAQGALRWHQRAWQAARGSSTRAQWGASYVAALVDTTPQAAPLIESTASTVLAELAREADGYWGRNRRSVQRIAGKLATWNAMGDHAARIARLARVAAPLCAGRAKGDAERSACEALFNGTAAGP